MLNYNTITLAHGNGGKLSYDLIQRLFVPKFNNSTLSQLDDSAILNVTGACLSFTTDSFVVKPLFFPDSDIGKLAVYGTVNDLAVTGAIPRYISCSLIIEEGFEISVLERIVDSMSEAAQISGVSIVTGDTKVVERGGADGFFVNTAGIGILDPVRRLCEEKVVPGDAIILSGTVGDHGAAVLSARGEFGFETGILSDCAPLNDMVDEILSVSSKVKFMRDPTRGGLATTLNEISMRFKLGIKVEQKRIPVRENVRGFCEILGIDPLYVANEGKLLAVVDRDDAKTVIDVMRKHPLGQEAAVIGEMTVEHPGRVVLETAIGGTRILDMLTSDQLPRIC